MTSFGSPHGWRESRALRFGTVCTVHFGVRGVLRHATSPASASDGMAASETTACCRRKRRRTAFGLFGGPALRCGTRGLRIPSPSTDERCLVWPDAVLLRKNRADAARGAFGRFDAAATPTESPRGILRALLRERQRAWQAQSFGVGACGSQRRTFGCDRRSGRCPRVPTLTSAFGC